jgi:hypothetical protein
MTRLRLTKWRSPPLEWLGSSAQSQRPLLAQARKREGAWYPDRAPFPVLAVHATQSVVVEMEPTPKREAENE